MEIIVDLDKQFISTSGKEYTFKLSQMEGELYEMGGIVSAFHEYGSKLFEVMCTTTPPSEKAMVEVERLHGVSRPLEW